MSDEIIPIDTRALEQRNACLDHAADLLASAERILGADQIYPNIAYHISLLALEEIGKSQLIISRAVSAGHRDPGWIDKRLDNHVFKMLWAVWSPTLFMEPIDPSRFEEARVFAQRLHDKRLQGLYVDYSESADGRRPSEAVTLEDVQLVMRIARAVLAREQERAPVGTGGVGSDHAWFFETVADNQKQALLFSRTFVEKLGELGDARAWIAWARLEFERIAAEEKEFLERELARERLEKGGRPKWQLQISLVNRWHSVRQKVLNEWNSQVEAAQLFTGKNAKNGDLLLRLTLSDNVRADQVFDAGLSTSKFVIAMLNIGSGGYLWFSTSELSDTYFDKAIDLDNPGMALKAANPRGLSTLHMQFANEQSPNHRDGLRSAYINNALKCLAIYSKMAETEAEPIFGPYLHGLVLLSKCDINLSCERDARMVFLQSLEAAARYFGDWSGDGEIAGALHTAFAEIIPTQGHRDQVLRVLGEMPEIGETEISWAFHTKRIVDTYLTFAADRQLGTAGART